MEILKSFQLVILQHVPREHNEEANRLAQSASGNRENQEALPWKCVLSGVIWQRMIGEKRLLII
jgi:hypothetical protein